MVQAKEILTRGLCAVALAWGGYVTWQLHQVVRARQEKKAEGYPQYEDFKKSGIVCICMLVAQNFFKLGFAPIARALIAKKARWSHQVWGAKVQRCCDALFKCGYYTVMMVWLLSFLRGEAWVPWVLGGSGETRFCWTDGLPFQPMNEDLKQYYLVAVGYHLCEVAMHMTSFGLPDFWEMLLHHTVTCFLVSFSYLLNYQRIGSLVLLLHGCTDIFIYMSKFLVDIGNVYLITLSYLSLISSYGYFRIYVFPMYVMKSAWVESLQVAGVEAHAAWGFLNFALCVLLLLHMYWFSLIIKIGMNFRKTGEARDMVANLSKMDMQDKKQS